MFNFFAENSLVVHNVFKNDMGYKSMVKKNMNISPPSLLFLPLSSLLIL